MIKLSSVPAVTSVGVFQFTTLPGDQINNGYHFGDLDGDGYLDMVIGGWAYPGNEASPNGPTKLLVLKQNSVGEMTAWADLTGATIAGTWQPLIADFNGDGRGDIGVAGFTDFPVTSVKSAFFMSSAAGYTRVDYADRISAHGANLADINGDGLMDVVTASYGAYDSVAGADRSADQYFLSQNGSIPIAVWNTPSADPWNRSPGGSAVAAGDLNNDGYTDFVVGDAVDTSIPLIDENGYFQRVDILVFKGDGSGMLNGVKAAKITPYFEIHHDGLSPVDFGDGSKFQETYSHDVRTMIADFDGDGLNDILTLSTNYSLGENASAIRIYRNQGDFQFVDMTDTWLSEYKIAWAADYSLQVRDFDGNGTIDLALAAEGSSTGHGNAIFLNDGSGHLHLAVRDEFLDWNTKFKTASNDYWYDNIPRFMPYLTADGTTNFQVIRDNIFLPDGSRASVYGTLNTQINFHLDFTNAITATGTGGNDYLVGWAGDDTFVGYAGEDTFDGGLGSDTASYANASAGVIASLANSAVNTGEAAGDQYISIENLTGSAFTDLLIGSGSNNVLNGGAGDDYLDGGLGDDTYYVDSSSDLVIEKSTSGGTDTVVTSVSYNLTAYVEWLFAQGSDTVSLGGNDLNNVIVGNREANTISGGSGNDTLYGGLGDDLLTGGSGSDRFVFDTTLNTLSNVDTITDFYVPSDSLCLENTIFTNVGSNGTLRASYFWIGTRAHDSSDRIIYDRKSGALYYDPDGTGAAGQIKFAQLAKGLKMTYKDFFVV